MKKCFRIFIILLFISFAAAGQNMSDDNFIYTAAPKKAIQTSGLNTLLKTDIVQNVSYYDGLGRLVQSIAIGQAGNGSDIITPTEYDGYGRKEIDYLPYAAANLGNDYIKTGAPAAVLSYYTAKLPNEINITQNAFSKKVIESSALSRVLKQASPGNDWSLGSGHEIKTQYKTNTANEVKRYTVTLTFANNTYTPVLTQSTANNGYYAADELYKTITFDENSAAVPSEANGSTVEFKNKEGQVILKRTYGIANANTVNEQHDTYYVYDKFGNLSYVLPPLLTNITTQLNDLAYQYKYDFKNRLVEKKLPGKQWEFLIYDRLDRVVATGPAASPFTDLSVGWSITKYDIFNRPVITGWMPAATVTSTDRINLQTARNTETTNFSETKTPSVITSTNNVNYRYTNLVWPINSATAPISIYHILTINYYDDYDYPNAPTVFNPVLSQPVFYNTATKPKGLSTGSWIRILEASTTNPVKAESNYILYDYKSRAVRSYTSNFLGGFKQIDNNFDFSGKLIYSITSHKRTSAGTPLPDIRDDYFYSNQDRLLSIKQTITGLPQQLIAANSYDELGQLISKKVGNSETAPLQIVDYNYNIRGWLKGINNINQLVKGTDPKDLFAFQINYNDIANVSKKLFNGNISQTLWVSDNIDKNIKNYIYTYDALNRLKSATDNTSNFNEDNIQYDKNGNIVKLKRTGGIVQNPSLAIPTNYGLMDDLTYTYDNGNKLMKVADAAPIDEFGFKDDALNTAVDTADDYSYDAKGNMLTDANRGITTNITYNHLNLPTKIVLPTGNITYLYNATGQKVQKTVVVNSPANTTTTEYLNGFQYKRINVGSTDLQFFSTSEGYVAYNAGVYSYVFQYKDHLGNVRLSYAKNAQNVLEIIEENNYYPFGLKHKGYNIAAVSTNQASKYKYNGKELQDELGLNVYDYSARNYDPALGRWMNIDPHSENYYSLSPYNSFVNNPITFVDPTGEDILFWQMNEKTGKFEQVAFNKLDKNIQKGIEAFGKTKLGYSFLASFANKGDKIGSLSFDKDGKYSNHYLYLNQVEGETGYEGVTKTPTFGKGSIAFQINLNKDIENPAINEAETLGHEVFLHLLQDLDDLVSAFNKGGRGEATMLDIEQSAANPSGYKDHRALKEDKQGRAKKYFEYISQLKTVLNPNEVQKLVNKDIEKSYKVGVQDTPGKKKK